MSDAGSYGCRRVGSADATHWCGLLQPHRGTVTLKPPAALVSALCRIANWVMILFVHVEEADT